MKLNPPLAIATLALSFLLSTTTMPVSAAPTCHTTNKSGFTVTLCISAPADEAVVSGSVPVTITRSTTGSPPSVDQVVATLDGHYLLTDHKPQYSFSIPTDHFVDGRYAVRVRERYNNDDSTDETEIYLTFQNGVLTPPVNTNTFTPYAPGGSPVFVAAIGDSASNRRPQVTDMVRGWNPQMLLYLGDVYSRGTFTEFHNWYTPTLGALRSITNPTVGNHEYDADGTASDYFFYWDNVPHYYSFDTGGWHIVVLDTNSDFDQLEPGTAQYDWLVQDLTQSASACTMVALHHPPLAVGRDGINNSVGDHFWPLFVSHEVDVVMTGHTHQYQRWYPVDADGNVAQIAPVMIANGTGGHHVDSFSDTDSRIAVGFDEEPEAFGAMQLMLYPDRMDFEFINDAGTVLDAGTLFCNGTQPISTPTPTSSPTSTPTPTLTNTPVIAPPLPPALLGPPSTEKVNDASPVFVWSENPSSENIIRYKLVVKNRAGKKVFVHKMPAELCDGVCTFDLGSTAVTLRNKRYFWHVAARNAEGNTKSAVWTVRIKVPEPAN